MSTIALLPPLTMSGPWGHQHLRALTEGPAYLRSRDSHRWHRTRSGTLFVDDGRISWHTWCGQNVYSGRCLTAERPDGLIPVCGTCEGRALGHDPQRPDLVFLPRLLTPPAKCPGSGRSQLFGQVAETVGRCLVCGQYAAIRAMGGPYDGYVGLTSHAPGAGLVEGCPFHAWRCLRRMPDGSVACGCTADRGAA